MLTQTRLQELFHYNKSTGLFIRLTSTGGTRVGDIAGHLHSESGYIKIAVDGKIYRAHRLAWLYVTGKFPKADIDHIDRIRSNNIWDNLREADRSQNICNMLVKSSNTGIKGICYYAKYGRYDCKIKYKETRIHKSFYVRDFKSEKDTIEAAITYLTNVRNILHGNFSQN